MTLKDYQTCKSLQEWCKKCKHLKIWSTLDTVNLKAKTREAQAPRHIRCAKQWEAVITAIKICNRISTWTWLDHPLKCTLSASISKLTKTVATMEKTVFGCTANVTRPRLTKMINWCLTLQSKDPWPLTTTNQVWLATTIRWLWCARAPCITIVSTRMAVHQANDWIQMRLHLSLT